MNIIGGSNCIFVASGTFPSLFLEQEPGEHNRGIHIGASSGRRLIVRGRLRDHCLNIFTL